MEVYRNKLRFNELEKQDGSKNLRAARALFKKGKNWITGQRVKGVGEDASYCLLGAIEQVNGSGANIARRAIRLALGRESARTVFAFDHTALIWDYNDREAVVYSDISKLIDKALRRLRR